MPLKINLDTIMKSKTFRIACIIDTIASVISFFFRNTEIGGWVFFITACLMLILSCFILFKYAKMCKIHEQYTSDNALLEKHIHDGLKYTKNEVMINFNAKDSKYGFTFSKEFEIISDDAPNWYSAQFYANKMLDNKEESKKYYATNQVKWADLNVRANISYKLPDADDFTEPQDLQIYNITDLNNYIPFHIKYITMDNRKLELTTGTVVRLTYCYSVPITLWGSYINRSISYFAENTIVKLRYDSTKKLEYKISRLSPQDGMPIDCNNFKKKITRDNDFEITTIELKESRFKKYRVWWNAEKYFTNDKNTVDTIDLSELTNY